MSVSRDAAERIGVVVIHGVGGARPGWINQDVIPHLMRHDPGLKFENHSEVEELSAGKPRTPADAFASEPFSSYLRRAGYGMGRNIVFMELFWADISRVGRGWVAALFVTLQVFYEAPLVLSAAFMRRRQEGLRRVIARLVRFANWLLRWPISGLNIAVFFAALGLAGVESLRESWPGVALLQLPDAAFVAITLAIIAATALRHSDRQDDKNILRSELAPSTAISAIVLLSALGIAYQALPSGTLEGLATYLLLAAVPILLFWLVWSHLVVAGIVLIALAALRYLLWPPARRLGTPMQPAAALGLTMMQGVIWKIVIALTWFILITTLEPGSLDDSRCDWRGLNACRDLGRLTTELVVIVTLNLIMAGILAVAMMAIFAVRHLMVKYRLPAVSARKATLPRVIVSRPAVLLMFVLTFLNFCVFYGPAYVQTFMGAEGGAIAARMNLVGLAQPMLAQYESTVKGIWIGIMAVLTFVILTSTINGVLHIVRDLVNHQYSWNKPGTAKWRIRSPWSQLQVSAGATETEHPRRTRIIERLDVLMREILARERCQRLVLVGHSQGSVILYDYLRSKWDDTTLASIERIDIVTLGSPLGHIYQHYFPDYEAPADRPADLNAKLKSWINLWRADDPIGHAVDVIGGGFIENVALPPGGHVDYWKDEAVCRVILDRIDAGRRGVAATPPPLRPART